MPQNGNGGLYSALAPLLPELRERGVRYFHVYTVDNILCKVADPAFIGYAIDKEADVVTKTIPKSAGELIGSVCIDKGSPRIVEYSELGPELAEKKTVDGRFLFGAGSIANHLYTLEFLERFCTPTFYLPNNCAVICISIALNLLTHFQYFNVPYKSDIIFAYSNS